MIESALPCVEAGGNAMTGHKDQAAVRGGGSSSSRCNRPLHDRPIWHGAAAPGGPSDCRASRPMAADRRTSTIPLSPRSIATTCAGWWSPAPTITVTPKDLAGDSSAAQPCDRSASIIDMILPNIAPEPLPGEQPAHSSPSGRRCSEQVAHAERPLPCPSSKSALREKAPPAVPPRTETHASSRRH